MIRPLAGLAAAALAAAALGGCSSSSGTGSGSAPASVAPSPTSAPGRPASTPASSSMSPQQSMTAIRPLRPITCASLPRPLGRFHHGGALPSGVPVPQAVPTLTCGGPSGVVAVVWSSVNAGQYRQELIGTGWHAAGAQFSKPGAVRTIQVTSVQAALVAVYRRA